MTWLIYPQYQAPVLTDSQQPEQVTESRWHQPWSEPIRFKTDPRLAIVLAAASGGVVPILPFPQLLSWFHSLSEPVRVPKRLHAALNPAEFQTLREPIVSFSYYNWFSEPVRFKPDLGAERQQAEWLVLAAFGEPPDYPKWGYAWSEPIWLDQKHPLRTCLQMAYTGDPYFGIRNPTNQGYIIC